MSRSLVLGFAIGALTSSCTNDFDQFEPGASGFLGGTGGATATTSTVGTGGDISVGVTTTTTGPGAGGSSQTSSSAASTGPSASSASSSASTGQGGGAPALPCGGMTCAPGQVCCHNGFSPNGDTCGAPGSCTDSVEVSCDGPASCPSGQVCCGQFGGSNGFSQIACAPSCTGQGMVVLCTGDPSVCQSNQMCRPSMLLGSPYEYCGN